MLELLIKHYLSRVQRQISFLIFWDSTTFLQRSLGQRVSQTVSAVTTEYLLDVQPGLYKVIAATASGSTDRFIHDPMGIAQHEDNSGDWHWMAKDGLGTMRGVYDDTLTEVYAADRDPYGDLIAATGTNPTPFEYTGEPEDQNGLLHLRARYYDPELGAFNSLDPLETPNRYAYVGGDPVNNIDPLGLQGGDAPLIPQCRQIEDDRARANCFARILEAGAMYLRSSVGFEDIGINSGLPIGEFIYAPHLMFAYLGLNEQIHGVPLLNDVPIRRNRSELGQARYINICRMLQEDPQASTVWRKYSVSLLECKGSKVQ